MKAEKENNKQENKEENKIIWYKSFAMTIFFWFLPLSIIPLLVVTYDANSESVKNLQKYAKYELEQSFHLEKKFVNNWFKYRVIDIRYWSQLVLNIDFLEQLKYDFKHSEKPLAEYIKSEEFENVSIAMGSDLYTIFKQYDYVYDLFLLDTKGNILFSVEEESDLGTNLLDGAYSKTKFAASYRATLKDKKIHFSDLEHYAPSHGIVTGFLTAPLFNNGEFIGVFVVQLKLDPIYNAFQTIDDSNQFIINYLVGSDGFLRSKISSVDEILNLHINVEERCNQSDINLYVNPIGDKVFGICEEINIVGVKMNLFSEANASFISTVTEHAKNKAIVYVFILLALIILAAYFITRKIVQPIKSLSEAVTSFTTGEKKVRLESIRKGELGLLAKKFKEMMHVVQEKEISLLSQRKEAHDALVALDEQKLALNAHSIVAITDIKGSITYVNDKFSEISGYSHDELIGKNHRILNSKVHSLQFWKEMYATIGSGQIWHNQVCNIAKDGHIYWVDTTIVPFMDEKSRPKSYIVIRTDITEQKLLQESLVHAKELAEESVKAKSEFLASMSHEIRTPMNGVIGMLGLLMNTKLDESQAHQAYLAQSSAKALLSLINDILDFSKIEAGKLELESIEFDVHKELGDFAEAIAFKAQEKGVELILDVSEIKVDLLYGDFGRIRQILNNIVGNSIKFTSHGHIYIQGKLEQKSEKSSRLKISVNDTGIGIPQSKIETLFDSFSQVDASTTRKYGGTGLGLAIVKKLCELMDGSVNVTSVLGEGSTFEIDIAVGVSQKAVEILPPLELVGKKALIVDTLEKSAQALMKCLEHWGMEVIYTQDSQDALARVDKSFDIVFVDKDIAPLSAESFADKLQENDALESIKLIIMTSVNDRRDINMYTQHGYSSYFPKPMTTSDIMNALAVLQENFAHSQEEDVTLAQETAEHRYSQDTKILLVDDNMVNRLVAQGILEEFGLEADEAKDGKEALEALLRAQDKPYDIILMDCQMPVMDGYEASTKIKAGEAGENNARIPIVAMTANAMEGDKEKCFAAGMDEYITKPIDSQKLQETLSKYLLKDVSL